jgi:alpha-tubulin suppressor-like RCC1 family protein
VVAGDTNSAAITRCGQVFMWGSCRSCIDLASNDPTKPTLVEALSGTPIAAVALGECHCLFLTTDGLVLLCGLDLYVQPAHTLRGHASGVPLGHLGHHSTNWGG